MSEIATKYMGLTLRNPLIVGSSSLTNSVDNLKELEKNGAGAVVLKSIFEEQIRLETEAALKDAEQDDIIYSEKSESLDYIDMHIKEDTLHHYINLIKEAKKELLIPVIASINCVTASEWVTFARELENAGADALELNIAIPPSELFKNTNEIEKTYFDIIQKVTDVTTLPVAVKISPYFTNLAQMIQNISKTNISSVVLFNRYYSPDFDLNNFSEISASTYSDPKEYTNTLRWTAIMSEKIDVDIAASTGVHDGNTFIKMLLAGASAVQVVSAIYKNGVEQIQHILNDVETWMEKQGYNYLDQFRGKMSQKNIANPGVFERIQFMKYFGQIGS
jgi:dihydroorotate dehydrogenase (fumarate)